MSLFTACPGSPDTNNDDTNPTDTEKTESTPGSNTGSNQGGNQGTTVNFDDPDGDITITFKSNISSSPVTITQKVKSNTIITLKPNSFTNENKDFVGWALTSNSTQNNIEYFDKSKAIFTQSTTLYAVWNTKNDNTININFYMNNTDDSEQPFVLKLNQTTSGMVYIKVPQSPFYKDGYSFIGWSTKKDIEYPYCKHNTSYPFETDQNLYAVWVQDGTIPVYYMDDYNEKNAKIIRINYNLNSEGKASITVPDCEFTNEGSFFSYFDINNSEYYPGYTFEASSLTRAYAYFLSASNAAKVTLHRNYDANDTEKLVYYTSKNRSTLRKNPYTREDYVFKEWNKNADGTSFDNYKDGDFFRVSEDIDLYAIWLDASLKKITYHSNYGDDETYEVEQAANTYFTPENASIFSRDGYQLLCWSREPDSKTSPYYFTNDRATITDDIDLYAFWGKEGCIATYHYEDGSTRTQSYVSNTEITKLEQPAPKEGYDWCSWAVEGIDTIKISLPYNNGYLKTGFSFTTDQESIDLYEWWMPCYTIKIYPNYEGAQEEYYTNNDMSDSYMDNRESWRVDYGNELNRPGFKIKGLSYTASEDPIISSIRNDTSYSHFWDYFSSIPNYDKGPQTVEYYIIWEETN